MLFNAADVRPPREWSSTKVSKTGLIADNPDQPIELKAFHAKVINDLAALKKEKQNFKPLPIIKQVDAAIIQRNFIQIKQDIENLRIAEMDRILNDTTLSALVVKR